MKRILSILAALGVVLLSAPSFAAEKTVENEEIAQLEVIDNSSDELVAANELKVIDNSSDELTAANEQAVHEEADFSGEMMVEIEIEEEYYFFDDDDFDDDDFEDTLTASDFDEDARDLDEGEDYFVY